MQISIFSEDCHGKHLKSLVENKIGISLEGSFHPNRSCVKQIAIICFISALLCQQCQQSSINRHSSVVRTTHESQIAIRSDCSFGFFIGYKGEFALFKNQKLKIKKKNFQLSLVRTIWEENS